MYNGMVDNYWFTKPYIHWNDFEREYIESQWKRYSFMVIAILAFPCFNMLSELCVLFIVFCMVNANNSMRLKQLEFSGWILFEHSGLAQNLL